jgi:RNA polymerase sigma-70 factor (ECF subfamily)
VAVAIDHASGEDEAFAVLYRETRAPLLAYCRRLVGPDGDAEGLTQEALVRGWRSWDRTTGRAFWPWAVTVARNLAVDESRKAGRRSHYASVAALATSGSRFPDPEDEVMRAAEHEAVRHAFDGLPPPYQTALHMHYVEGHSYQEIADLQHVSTETVRGMLRRSRQALRAAYSRLDQVSAFVAVTAVMRRARVRMDDWASRTHARLADAGSFLAHVEAVHGAVMLAVVISTGAATVAPSDPTPTAGPAASVAAPARGRGQTQSGATNAQQAAAAAAAAELADGDVATTPPGALPLGLGGAPVTTPEEAWFTQLATVPGSRTDTTVIGVGRSSVNCPGVACHVLFLSEDMGTTWRRLPADGFHGGTVLLPPSWPVDNRIFVIAPDSLQVSTDGGATFRAVAPTGQTGAMSPSFSSGDPVIWVGLAPGWAYHDDTKALTPLDLWPPPIADAATYAFAPAWPADRRVLVGGWSMGQDGAPTAMVTGCAAGMCGNYVTLPGVTRTPQLLTMPSFGKTGAAFAWAGDRLLRSMDAGASFADVELPGPGLVSSLVATADDTLYLGLADVTPEGEQVGGLYVSQDRGDSWRQLGAKSRLTLGVASIVAGPDGRLVAGMQPSAGGGVLCSTDAGKSWSRRCD